MTGAAKQFPRAGTEDAILRAIFPGGCAVSARRTAGDPADLFDVEASHVRQACPRRQGEFAAGRACVRAAFRAIGVPPYAVPADGRRAPVWPLGLVGSISHCPGLCVAVVAPRPRRMAVGVDVDTNEGLPFGLENVVATPAERGAAERLGRLLPCDPLKLLFVIKEAMFKLYFPVAQHFLEFRDMWVRLDPVAGTFDAELVEPRAPSAFGRRRFAGRFGMTGDFLMAGGAI